VFDHIKEHRPIPIEAKSHPVIKDILEPRQDNLRNVFGYQQETTKIQGLVERLKEATIKRQSFTDGVILTGKPGTGKTNLATAIALKSGMRTVVCDTAAMLQGNSVELMQSFLEALHAIGPAIVIMEEAEVLLKHREKLNQTVQIASNILLSQLDGPIEDKVPRLWIVTTNFGDDIDSAYRRAGRLSHQIDIPLPCAAAREEALKFFIKEYDISLSLEELKLLTIISGNITIKKMEDHLVNAKTLNKTQARTLTLLDIIDQFIPPRGSIKDEAFSAEKEQDRENVAHRIAGEIVLRHSFSAVCTHYFASVDHLIYYGDDDLLKPKNYRALERKTMSMLSGRAAEAILRGSDTLSALLSDTQEEELVRYASKATNTVMLSMQTLNDELVQNSQPYKLEMMFIHKMYASVHATLEKNWDDVTSIADLLLEKGCIFNEDIRRHFEKTPLKSEVH
jgi:ATP-dependent Zn protease